MPVASLTQWWGGCATPPTTRATARASSSGRTPSLQVRATAMQEKAFSSSSAAAAPPTDSTRFLRPHLLKLAAYTPIEPFEVLSARFGRTPQEIIKLDANENPYGPPPEVREALASMPFPHIYPDPETRRLRQALAEMNGIEAEHLMVSRCSGGGLGVGAPARGAEAGHAEQNARDDAAAAAAARVCGAAIARRAFCRSQPHNKTKKQVGCGADELIDLLMRCCLEPGDAIVDCPPTFTMYAFDADVNDARVLTVPRLPGFRVDVEAIKCVFLCVFVVVVVGERVLQLVVAAVISHAARRLTSKLTQKNTHTKKLPNRRVVLEQAPKMLFLTSPNNPDVSTITDAELLPLLDLPVLVVLDEAYIEFAPPGTSRCVRFFFFFSAPACCAPHHTTTPL